MSELIKSIFREYDIRGIFPDELNEDSIAFIINKIEGIMTNKLSNQK